MWRAELCFIKKPFFPCLLILHHNHHGGHLHNLLYFITHQRQVGSFLQYPPPSSYCWFSGNGLLWLILCWYDALAGTCSEWMVPMSLVSLGILKASPAWLQPSLLLLLYTTAVLYLLPITVSWNPYYSWIWQYSIESWAGSWHFPVTFQTFCSFTDWLQPTFSSHSVCDFLTWPIALGKLEYSKFVCYLLLTILNLVTALRRSSWLLH